MMYDRAFFDQGIERRNTACEKWDDRNVMGEDGIPLWVADMDFRCAEPIVDALKKRAEHACYGYPICGDEDREAFIHFTKRRHGISLQSEDIAFLPCVVTGMKVFIRAFSKPGDRIAILTPVYGPFTSSIECNQRIAERIALTIGTDGRYQIDFDALEEAFRQGVRHLMLCSPHNPVSRVWTKEELERLLALCRQYGVFLSVDEIHAEFVYEPQSFTSILSLAKPEDAVVCFMSASKTFNIAGLQQAMMISYRHDLLKAMQQELIAGGGVWGNTFALAGTRAAYELCDDWLDGLMAYLQSNLEVMKREIARQLPLARIIPVEATYLAWLDLR